MKKKNGFTLIELLAVIVILGVIMFVAIPSIGKIITNAKKDSFVSTGKNFIGGARNASIQGTFRLPVAPGGVTIVPINLIELERGGQKSTFDEAWNYDQSYVAIVNSGTQDDPTYDYYFAAKDAGGNGIYLTKEKELKRSDVTTNAAPESLNVEEACKGKEKGEAVTSNVSIGKLTGNKTIYCMGS